MMIRSIVSKPDTAPAVASGLGRWTLCRRAFAGALLCLMSMGCMSGGQIYTYRNMPTDLVAVKRDNVQTIDLTRLACSSLDSEVIDRGDVLEISISPGLDEKSRIKLPVRVSEDGIAKIPEIGPVQLAGMDMQAAEAVVVAACVERQLYRNPSVSVTMKQQRMNRVTVVGAVTKPDVYELPRGRSDLLAALVAAGGLDKDAGTKIEIRNPHKSSEQRPEPIASGAIPGLRSVGLTAPDGDADSESADGSWGGMDSLQVDLVSATKEGTSNYQVADGGIVSVEKRDPEPLHVIGLVKNPNRYDFPIAEDLRVTDAIAMAGGTAWSIADKVYVIRRKPNTTDTAVIQVSLKQAKSNAGANLRLAPGDVVSVEQTAGTMFMEVFNIVRIGVGGSLPLNNL